MTEKYQPWDALSDLDFIDQSDLDMIGAEKNKEELTKMLITGTEEVQSRAANIIKSAIESVKIKNKEQ